MTNTFFSPFLSDFFQRQPPAAHRVVRPRVHQLPPLHLRLRRVVLRRSTMGDVLVRVPAVGGALGAAGEKEIGFMKLFHEKYLKYCYLQA